MWEKELSYYLRDRLRCSSDKVGKWWQWCLVIILVLLPVCSKNLWGTVPQIPVEKKNGSIWFLDTWT
jgi:hypothetical protein